MQPEKVASLQPVARPQRTRVRARRSGSLNYTLSTITQDDGTVTGHVSVTGSKHLHWTFSAGTLAELEEKVDAFLTHAEKNALKQLGLTPEEAAVRRQDAAAARARKQDEKRVVHQDEDAGQAGTIS